MSEPTPKLDTNTCWDSDGLTDEMNSFFDIHRHNPETTQHFRHFQNLLSAIPLTYLGSRPILLDIGCGTGMLQDYIEKPWVYIGCDREAVVRECLNRNYPNAKGFSIDLFGENPLPVMLSLYRVCVINGILDVAQFPLEFLKKILERTRDYMIIHRQEIRESEETEVIKNGSYGGYTYHSKINRNDFNQVLEKMRFEIIKEERLDCGFPWENGGSSFLLKRKEQ
jgi:SAM-dependent methyltransferase